MLLAAASSAQEKFDAKKLVGSWELQKTATVKEKDIYLKTTMVMTRDGKFTNTEKVGGKSQVVEGVYKLEGRTITLTVKLGDGNDEQELATLNKLTDDELVIGEPKGGTATWKKIKPKK